MDFSIRAGKPQDASSIARVHVESWRTTYKGIVSDSFLASLNEEARTESWRPQLAGSNTSIFVAEDETGIFGFISGGRARKIDSLEESATCDAELYAIYLLQSHQGHGAGRALVRILAAALHAQGNASMIVLVLEANPAVRFYQRLGAISITRQNIEIGNRTLPELVLAWPSLDPLL